MPTSQYGKIQPFGQRINLVVYETQRNADFRVRLEKFGNPRNKQHRPEIDRCRNAQQSRRLGARRYDRFASRFDEVQALGRVLVEGATEFRQLYPARGAIEQLRPEGRFEPCNDAADRCAGEPKLARGGAEAARRGDPVEDGDVVQVEPLLSHT